MPAEQPWPLDSAGGGLIGEATGGAATAAQPPAGGGRGSVLQGAGRDPAKGAAKVGLLAITLAGGALMDAISRGPGGGGGSSCSSSSSSSSSTGDGGGGSSSGASLSGGGGAAGSVGAAGTSGGRDDTADAEAPASRSARRRRRSSTGAPSSGRAPAGGALAAPPAPRAPPTAEELLLAQQLQALLRGLGAVDADLEALGPGLRAAAWRAPRGSDLARAAAALAARASELRHSAERLRAAPAVARAAAARPDGGLALEAACEYLGVLARHLEAAAAPPSASTAGEQLLRRLRQHVAASSTGGRGGGDAAGGDEGGCEFDVCTHAVVGGALCRLYRDGDAAGGAPVVLAPGRTEVASLPRGARRLLAVGDPADVLTGRVAGARVVGRIKIGLRPGEGPADSPAVGRGGARKHVVVEGQLVAVFEGVLGQRVAAPLLVNGLVEDAGSWVGRGGGGGAGRAWLLAQCVRSREAREGYVEAYLKFGTPRRGSGGGGGGAAKRAARAKEGVGGGDDGAAATAQAKAAAPRRRSGKDPAGDA